MENDNKNIDYSKIETAVLRVVSSHGDLFSKRQFTKKIVDAVKTVLTSRSENPVDKIIDEIEKILCYDRKLAVSSCENVHRETLFCWKKELQGVSQRLENVDKVSKKLNVALLNASLCMDSVEIMKQDLQDLIDELSSQKDVKK